MRQFTITLVLIFVASFAFADGNGEKKTNSEITPKSGVTQDGKSFEVNTMKACTGEFDTEDGISTFEDESTVHLMELIPLTEDMEDSGISTYDEVTTSASSTQL